MVKFRGGKSTTCQSRGELLVKRVIECYNKDLNHARIDDEESNNSTPKIDNKRDSDVDHLAIIDKAENVLQWLNTMCNPLDTSESVSIVKNSSEHDQLVHHSNESNVVNSPSVFESSELEIIINVPTTCAPDDASKNGTILIAEGTDEFHGAVTIENDDFDIMNQHGDFDIIINQNDNLNFTNPLELLRQEIGQMEEGVDVIMVNDMESVVHPFSVETTNVASNNNLINSSENPLGTNLSLTPQPATAKSLLTMQHDVISPASTTTPPGCVGKSGRKVEKPLTQRVQRKLFKETGREYRTKKGKIIPAKRVRPGCTAKCKQKCGERFTEEDRVKINSDYWALSPVQQREFLLKFVQVHNKKTATVEDSRRQFSRNYSLPKNDQLLRVCRTFFISTLNVGSKLLRYTESHCTTLRSAKRDERGAKSSTKKTSPMNISIVKKYIERLPAVDSHYCRSSTKKKYVPQEYESLASIYRKYVQHCQENNYQCVTQYVFNMIWKKDYHIGVHSPKKDKCTSCALFENLTNPTFEEVQKHEEHLAENAARKNLYLADQEETKKVKNKNLVTCSFDLQKVLNTPCGKSMLFFYSRKYATYNLTFYETETRDTFCYLWGKKEGKRGCIEICTAMENYLQTLDDSKVTEVRLYCDNCAGQQKNKTMIGLLLYFMEKSKSIRKITLNFLLSGHSFMTVDSVHGTIERATTHKTVYAPSEWSTIISNARYEPRPYNVIPLTHADFKDWKKFTNSRFNLKLEKGPFKISEVQRCVFTKQDVKKGEFRVFFNARETTSTKVTCVKKRNAIFEPCQAYTNQLPIAAEKYKDLNTLCVNGSIPQRYHAEYFNIPFSNSVRDALNEPDDEENVTG